MDGKIYRISYNGSAISIHLIEWDEKREKFRLGERIVYEQKDSSLYQSLDREGYLEQIKAITYEQISGEYKVKIDDSFQRSIGEKIDLVERKRAIPTKPRKEPKPKKKCSSSSQTVQSKCDLEIVDMSQHKIQAYINEKTSAFYSRKNEGKEKTKRNRFSRFVIKVRFPDGKVLSSKDAGSTLIDVILYAGPEKVRQLEINSLGDNLVSHALSKNSIRRAAQKRIDNGLYVCVCSSDETIYRQILMIDYGCNLGLDVEKVFLDGYVPYTKRKTKTKTRRDAFKKRNDSEDEINEDVNDSEDDIHEDGIPGEGKIGDTIRLLPSQKKCEIIGTRVDHEGYEKLVLRTANYRLIEIDNNPYLYIVLKRQ